jgi:hypothetical protein
MGTFFRESSMVVKRASSWVQMVAKTRCHVVREMAATVSRRVEAEETNDKLGALAGSVSGRMDVPNFFRSRIHLLNMMTDELRAIQTLEGVSQIVSWQRTHAM